MSLAYKLIVTHQNIYKEFEIPEKIEKFTLGTTPNCQFRLEKDYFFSKVEIGFVRDEDEWKVISNDELYLSLNDGRKLSFCNVKHGDVVNAKYVSSGTNAFSVEISINFEAQIPIFNSYIEVSGKRELIFSNNYGSDLVLLSRYCNNTQIVLEKKDNAFYIRNCESQYDIYINGKKVEESGYLTDYDFFSVSDVFLYFKENKIYFDKQKVDSSSEIGDCEVDSEYKYPIFIRSTKRKIEYNTDPITILDPEAKKEKPEMNIITSLAPAIIMFLITIVFRGMMGNNRGVYIIFTVCSMGIGLVTSVINLIKSQKKYNDEVDNRTQIYKKYIYQKEEEIKKARENESEILRINYYSQEKAIEKVLKFEPDIFDRISEDEDFMDVTLGFGSRIAKKTINYKQKETLETGDLLSGIPDRIAEKYKYIQDAPIVLSLKNIGAVGVCGNAKYRKQFFNNILVDLVCRQYHTEISMYLIADENIEEYEWIKYLPQFNSESGRRNVVFDDDSRVQIFDMLYKELSFRQEHVKEKYKPIVVFVLYNNGMFNHPISKFIKLAAGIQVTFIFCEEGYEFLPQHCQKIIELTSEGNGLIYDASNRLSKQSFEYKTVNNEDMYKLARKISPVYCEEINLESSLRKSITMFEMLGIYEITDVDINKNWNSSKIYDTMAAPIGINSKEEIVCLDLHEKAHGPHGLVAGTTGSGKSEILQTYILSMALNYHPYEVGFVIIDFKGGGMVNQFSHLPHLIGAITNIDGNEIDRSLKSIRAEILKRQELFAEVGVNNIEKYIRSYNEGKTGIALPHLIIIVDEFAELKAEQPEFMKELISASRIGRSLGVHLILATQKPAGQVSDQIWSNSRFKLCLKVQDQSDSKEVIKSPLAAEIKEPGRAYLQVGNNEIFELFQSGYSGANEKSTVTGNEYKIYEVEFSGERKIIYENKKQTVNASRTQLEAIVSYVNKYCIDNKIEKLSPICLPSLATHIPYKGNQVLNKKDVYIGIYDDPESQKQEEYSLDLYDGNTIIIGSAGMGKTNLLQTIIESVSNSNSPAEVNLYLIDFGSMFLKNYEKINIVGGIITVDDDEKFKNLVKMLLSELQDRKYRFAELGLTSYDTYLESGRKDIPRIVVMIDNFIVYKNTYEEAYGDSMMNLLREGVAYGITFVITNSQSNGLTYKYLACFSNRISLFCNESTEYGNLFEKCKLKIGEIQGRAIVSINRNIYEMQTFVAFDAEKESEKIVLIKQFIEDYNLRFSYRARMIPQVPETLDLEYIFNDTKYTAKSTQYPLGMDYDSIDVRVIDLNKNNELCVCGDDEERKKQVVSSLINTTSSDYFGTKANIVIVDSIERKYRTFCNILDKAEYLFEEDSFEIIINRIYEELSQRFEEYIHNESFSIAEKSNYIIIVNDEDKVNSLAKNREVYEKYKEIIKKYKTMGVLFVYTFLENAAIPYSASDLIKALKEKKFVISITAKAMDIKTFDMPTAFVRKAKTLDANDAYLINNNDAYRIKLIK